MSARPTPILTFFYSATCGYSRRMDSLVDHYARLHRTDLRIAKVDVDKRPDLAARFDVTNAPTIVLLVDLAEVERLEGRSTLPTIRACFDPIIDPDSEFTEDRTPSFAFAG